MSPLSKAVNHQHQCLSSFFLRIPLHSADSGCGMFQNLAMGISEDAHQSLPGWAATPKLQLSLQVGSMCSEGEMSTAWETGSKSATIHISPGLLKGRQDSDELLNIKEAPMGV